jgi:hypothetical protein
VAPAAARRQNEKESPSFLKKRSKRLLFLVVSHLCGQGPDLVGCAEIKVFLLLFLQKKKILPAEFFCVERTLPTRVRAL